MPVKQVSPHYKTYVKEALTQALRNAFQLYPDDLVKKHTKVDVDFPLKKVDYPAIVVRFYERTIKNAGIGHREYLELPDVPGRFVRYKHIIYSGDIEFAVYAESSLDRDLISDALIHTLTMAETTVYTNQFLERIYDQDPDTNPISAGHFVNLNTDSIQGFGESQVAAPWQPEDVLVYQTAYRLGIMGEVYSLTPTPTTYGKVEKVERYPYMPANHEPVPNPNPEDPTPWDGDNDW